MSDYPPPPPNPPQPPAGGPPPTGGYGEPGGYGVPPTAGGTRPGELLDRFLARLIDGILVGIVYVILSLILGAILVTSVSVDPDTFEVSGGSRVLYNIVFSVISTALYLGYFVFMETSRGQTIGKMAMKLKVVGPTGANPTPAESLKRNIWMGAALLAILGTIGSVLGSLLQLGAVILIAVGISGDPVKRQHYFDHFAGETEVLKIG